MKRTITLSILLANVLFANAIDQKNIYGKLASIQQEYSSLQENKAQLYEEMKNKLNIEYVVETKDLLLEETLEAIKDDKDYMFVSTILKMIQLNLQRSLSFDRDIHTLLYSKINDLSFKYQLIDIQKLADQLSELTQNNSVSMSFVNREIVVRNNNIGANIREHPIYSLSPAIIVSKEDTPDGTILRLIKDVELRYSHWGKIIVLNGKYAGTVGWINLRLTKEIF